MNEPIDYRELLIKYMRLVKDREGYDYLEDRFKPGVEVQFTNAEYELLNEIAEQL